MRTGPLLVLLLALGALALPSGAGAHAVLLATEPAADTVVDAPPSIIELTFNEPVNQVGATAILYGPDGRQYQLGEPMVDGSTLFVPPAGDLPEGTSTVVWGAISADGHRVAGAFSFSVGAPSAEPGAAAAYATGPPATATAAASVVRAARYAGIIGAIGFVAVLWLVWIPTARRGREADPDAAEAADDAFRRASGRVGAGAFALAAAASAAAVPVLAWTGGIDVAEVLQLRQGMVAALGAVVALLGLPLALLAAREPRPSAALAGGGLIALVLAAGQAVSGHASAQPANAIPLMAADLAHLLAAGLWGGGLLVLALAGADARGPLLRGVTRRFTRLALAGLAVLLVTGAITALVLAGSPRALAETPWGWLLLAKVALVALAVAIAAVIRRGGARFERGIAAEALVIIAVIAVTGALTGIAPRPEPAPALPYAEQARVGETVVLIDIVPARAGIGNEVHVIATDAQGMPSDEVEEAAVTLASDEVERLPVELQRIDDGHWTGSVVLPTPGTWTVTTRLRIGDFRDEAIVGTMPVAP
jgi:copper transport protein